MNMHFAIPSYRRAETLAAKTLPLLRWRLGVQPEAITVFVSDHDELDHYQTVLLAAGLGDTRFAKGARGCGGNHNVITRHWPVGQRVVRIDDDLRDLLIKRNDQLLEPITPVEFNEILAAGFTAASGGLWGIHPVPNAYFQRAKISQDLRYICGGFFGFTTRSDDALLVDLEDKEDFERSIKAYLADGRVTRLNWISMRTAGYSGKGGMQVDRTAERVDWSARELARRYPDLCSLNLKKKSGWAEVRLRDRRPQPSTLA